MLVLSGINPLLPGVLFFYSLKTSEKHRFSDVLRGYKNRTQGSNGPEFNGLKKLKKKVNT